ncbi:benenodin family lasso peptide [Allosphingosinicella humi]
MERNEELHDDIVELGLASIETEGPFGTIVEPSLIGKLAGITDE